MNETAAALNETAGSILATTDWVVMGVYAVVLFSVAIYVSLEKKGHEKNTADYFLASRSLPWWAVGASLVAANISAEQIMGMSGSAYVTGLAIATWEWTAAIALLVMAKFFLPIYREKKIYTIPEFLEKRFDHRVRTVLAIFWVSLYVLVNLTSIMYLGGLAIKALTGYELIYGMLFLGLFSLAYSLYGGLKAVAFTDLIQVTLLMVGCGVLTWIVLGKLGDGDGVWAGFMQLQERLPEYFDMVLAADHPDYINLPGISVLIGGVWIAHFSYWGFSQYITQRAVAAKSVAEAQKGVVMAAYMKIMTPFIIVVPGIAGVLLIPGLEKGDDIYPTLMGFLPTGLLGVTFAALVAAIVSSLSSMINSISTIFTMDLWRRFRSGKHSERELVIVGRSTALAAMLIALVVAEPLLGKQEQAFQFIQKYTGFITPGIVAIFFAALFWKKANSASVLAAVLASLLFTFVFELLYPEFPWIDRMGLSFIVSVAVMMLTVWIGGWRDHPNAIKLDKINFGTNIYFNVNTAVILIILGFFYAIWW